MREEVIKMAERKGKFRYRCRNCTETFERVEYDDVVNALCAALHGFDEDVNTEDSRGASMFTIHECHPNVYGVADLIGATTYREETK